MFGFLKNDDLGIPGNQGLQDIIMALRLSFMITPSINVLMNRSDWIQKNIAFFKGNPSETTLVGQSTGGSLIRTLLATQVPSLPTLTVIY